MKDIDLYIYLPDGSYTAYNKCFHISSLPIDINSFFDKLEFLKLSIAKLNVSNVYYVGGQFYLNKYYGDIFKIFSNYYQTVLTNGINLDDNIDILINNVDRIDICRFSIYEKLNQYYFNSNKVPTIIQLEKLLYNCHQNNLKTRLTFPIHSLFCQDLNKLIQLSKYLETQLLFRQLTNDCNKCNFIEKQFYNYSNIYYDIKNNYKLIVKQINSIIVWIQYISDNKKNNDYIVYHPNGILSNRFKV